MSRITFQSQAAVSETLLIPLYCRALKSQRPDALLKDEKAAALIQQIDYDFTRIKVQKHDLVATILRMWQFDHRTRDFLARSPKSVVVHIGCGLDTRFERVDNGRVEWYDLDLPDIIEIRRKLLGEGPRSHLLACSVLDRAWLKMVNVHHPRPFLFLAEGVFPYFEQAQVRSLFLTLQKHFPGSELVCDTMTPFIIWANNLQLAFSKFGARLHWGLKEGKDIESWGAGIRLLEHWFYLDHPDPSMGIQWMRHFPFLAKSTGILHCRFE